MNVLAAVNKRRTYRMEKSFLNICLVNSKLNCKYTFPIDLAVVAFRCPQDKNGKEVREETDGKFGRVHRER